MQFDLLSLSIGETWGFMFMNVIWGEDEDNPGNALLGFYKTPNSFAIEVLGFLVVGEKKGE